MTINEFAQMSFDRAMKAKSGQKSAFDTEYFLIGLAGEIGECMNLLKKFKRGDINQAQFEEKLFKELADVYTYNQLAYSSCGIIDIENQIMKKYEEVNRRLAAGGFDMRPE